MVDPRKELPFLFCEFGPSSRVNCVTRPQNGGFIPIVYIRSAARARAAGRAASWAAAEWLHFAATLLGEL